MEVCYCSGVVTFDKIFVRDLASKLKHTRPYTIFQKRYTQPYNKLKKIMPDLIANMKTLKILALPDCNVPIPKVYVVHFPGCQADFHWKGAYIHLCLVGKHPKKWLFQVFQTEASKFCRCTQFITLFHCTLPTHHCKNWSSLLHRELTLCDLNCLF